MRFLLRPREPSDLGGVHPVAEEELEQSAVADLRLFARGLSHPLVERLPARGRERVDATPATFGLALLVEEAELDEMGGLRVQLRVREVPEVPDRARRLLLHVVGGRRALGDQAEHDVGDRSELRT